MKFKMFSRVALKANLPRHQLRRGDVATIVEYHRPQPKQEPGYTLEIFNAVGDTIAIITVRESQIEPLNSMEILNARQLAAA